MKLRALIVSTLMLAGTSTAQATDAVVDLGSKAQTAALIQPEPITIIIFGAAALILGLVHRRFVRHRPRKVEVPTKHVTPRGVSATS